MVKKIVSIVTPFYNSEAFMFRLMDSILQQTYPFIEMIAVNNGSTDKTGDLLNTYKLKFIEKGYNMVIVNQANLGPSGGFQTGVKLTTGDYLLVPDSDDFYYNEYVIEKMVSTFEQLSDDYGTLRWQIQEVYQEDMSLGRLMYGDLKVNFTPNIFEDCLFGQNGYAFPAIGYMVKLDYLKQLTNLEFYHAMNVGQNRQVCCPMYYYYKTYTILEPMAYYFIRKDSDSHGDCNKYQVRKRLYSEWEAYIDSILGYLKDMPSSKRKQYRDKFLFNASKSILMFALGLGEYSDAVAYYKDARRHGRFAVKEYSWFCMLFAKSIIKKCMHMQ